MMSLEAVWELRAPASPRSLCVYDAIAAAGQSTNPFEPDKGGPHPVSVVFGTEAGSLHYRTFPAPVRTLGKVSGAHGHQSPTRSGSSSSSSKPVLPLGVQSKGGGSHAKNVPRHYHPVDLAPGSLPGLVAACLKVGSSSRSGHAVFLLLVDDGRGTSASQQPGAYQAVLIQSAGGSSFRMLPMQQLPRMSCAAYHATTGLVYAAGRHVQSLQTDTAAWEHEDSMSRRSAAAAAGGGRHHHHKNRLIFSKTNLPSPGIRSGQDGLALTAGGKVAVVAVGNSFYAVAGQEADQTTDQQDAVKILSFQQSSQVHPVIAFDVQDLSVDDDWSCLFLASGRECAVVDLYYADEPVARVSSDKPRNGIVTVASPILAAVASWPWVAVLTSDGLISVRSPSCLAIPLRTVELGQRPNDYFILRSLHDETQVAPWIVAMAYSGECKVLQCQPDTAQDLADRLMRHAIDAFGANGFPRDELAEAVKASFTATSYVGPESSPHSRSLLRQYLEAVLGLVDFEAGGSSGWPTELSEGDVHHGTFGDHEKGTFSGRGAPSSVITSASPASLVTGSALLCLVCSQLSPPNSTLASRAAKACTEKMGVVFEGTGDISKAAAQVTEQIADKLLQEASSNFSLLKVASPSPAARVHRSQQSSIMTEFIEAAIWLLRSCGKHERAIEVAYERLQQQGQTDSAGNARGYWSQIKYESYTATHLSEIWGAGKDEGCRLVLKSPATYRLLENNPRLGLSVFTAMHPQNETQWRSIPARDDPLANPERTSKVIGLLKSINPAVPYDKDRAAVDDDRGGLPLESGRAVTVSYLWSAIGIATGRPVDEEEFETLPTDSDFEEHISNFHDELSFLLLEGVIAERRDDERDDTDTELGKIYRSMLRQLLKWPLAKLRPDKFMEALPSSFLPEKALVLGRVGRHEDALRILYCDLKSLDLALEYCDDRHAQQKSLERARARQQQASFTYSDSAMQEALHEEDNAYLPLIRVALDSEDTDRGTATAIKVLALRRGSIDRAAALRLLPSDVPVSAVARPFLIPALVDSESQVRRLTVTSALLRARYLRLKDQLTTAQLKAQANLAVVPALRSLNLGEPLHSSKAFRARTTSSQPARSMPDVQIVKHFFPRHLVIQARVTNSSPTSGGHPASYSSVGAGHLEVARTLSDIAFVVAESSEEEAIQPLLQVPIAVLPPGMTGSAWCVLTAQPRSMDGSTAALTCELRYTVQSSDAASNLVGPALAGRTYVEELQDLEVHAAHFFS